MNANSSEDFGLMGMNPNLLKSNEHEDFPGLISDANLYSSDKYAINCLPEFVKQVRFSSAIAVSSSECCKTSTQNKDHVDNLCEHNNCTRVVQSSDYPLQEHCNDDNGFISLPLVHTGEDLDVSSSNLTPDIPLDIPAETFCSQPRDFEEFPRIYPNRFQGNEINAQANSPEVISQPRNFCLSNFEPCHSLDLSCIDENKTFDSHTAFLSSPKYNSLRILQQEAMDLAEKVKIRSSNEFDFELEALALKELTDPFLLNQQSSPPSLDSVPVAVNVPLDAIMYPNLMDLSITESEIVREEKVKIAQRRRQMSVSLKRNTKKNILPHPSPLKFFDPKQHVFQSPNIELTGLPSFLPPLERLPRHYIDLLDDNYPHL